MNRKVTWILLAGLLVFTMPAFAGKGGKLPFSHDVEKGMTEAKQSGQAMILYFTRDG